jgi:hypothetical protein
MGARVRQFTRRIFLMTDDMFDFGFTAVDEDELTAVKALRTTADEVAEQPES